MLCERDPTLLLDQPGRLKSIVETSLHLFQPLLKPSLIVDTSLPELLGEFIPRGLLLLLRVTALGDLLFLNLLNLWSFLESPDLSPRFLHHLLI